MQVNRQACQTVRRPISGGLRCPGPCPSPSCPDQLKEGVIALPGLRPASGLQKCAIAVDLDGYEDMRWSRFRNKAPREMYEIVSEHVFPFIRTLTWVDWFNNRRLLEPIGNIPPAEAEERYYAMLEKPDMAA